MKTHFRTLIFEPGKPAKRAEVEDTLEAQQAIVGGYIEMVSLAGGLKLICNEEGKLDGLPPNRRMGTDVIAGTFFLCRVGEDGETLSVTDADIEAWKNR